MRHRLKTVGLGVALLGGGAGLASAAVTPIAVSGYNQDIVVEAGAPAAAAGVTTATMDGGTANTGGAWYEQGFNAAAPTTGLPAKGSVIVSASLADHSYRMPASYGPGNGAAGTTNNAFVVGQGTGSPTIVFGTPATYSVLSLLGSAGHGPNTVAYTINYANSTTQTGTLTVGDWFNGAGAAYSTNGRLTVNTGAFDNVNAGNPRLYSFDISLTNTSSAVTSISLSSASNTSTAAFFAVSGTAVPEPGSIAGLAVGGIALLGRRSRRRAAKP